MTLRSTATVVLRILRYVLVATGLMPGLLWDVDVELWRRQVEDDTPVDSSDFDGAWLLAALPGVH